MKAMLWNDDTPVAIPEAIVRSDATIRNRVKYRARQFFAWDLKTLDFIQELSNIVNH